MALLPDESQLNNIIALCVNKHITSNRTKETYQDIMTILDKKEFESVIASKYKLARVIVKSLIEGNSVEYSIENGLGVDPEFQQHRDFINMSYDREINETEQKQTLKTIELKLLQTKLNISKGIFKKFYEHIHEGKNYETTEEAWEAFEDVAVSLYQSYTKGAGIKSKHESESFIWGDGDPDYYERLRHKMILKYDKTKKTPTGFSFLDDILQGGFERQSLYIFGGNPGAGKSTILLNLIRNAAINTKYVSAMKDRLKLFIFISAENSVLQTSMRLNCLQRGITSEESNKMLIENPQYFAEFESFMTEHNSKVAMDHDVNNPITITRIELFIDSVMEKYKDQNPILGGIYIDYLDRLKPAGEGGKKRHEQLDVITQQLKGLSIKYDAPVISATQLTRESYDIKEAKHMSPKLIAESMSQVRLADFLALMAVNNEDKSTVFFKVGKNRDGESGQYLDFKVDFSRFTFSNCSAPGVLEFDYKDTAKSFNGFDITGSVEF